MICAVRLVVSDLQSMNDLTKTSVSNYLVIFSDSHRT